MFHLHIFFVLLTDGFVSISAGVFTYLSYRDPNLIKTLDNYDGTVQFLREIEMDNDALTKAIIGTIGDVDGYQLPDAKGYSRYALSRT
jgi:Zn-dependent M16 (insulinase) family peptidase